MIGHLNGEPLISASTPEEHSFFEFAEVLLKQKDIKHYDAFLTSRAKVRNFKRFCEDNGISDLKIGQINSWVLKGFQNFMLARGRKGTTVNSNVGYIMETLRAAIDCYPQEVCMDVFHKVDKIAKAQAEIKDKLTVEEFVQLAKMEFDKASEFHARNIFLYCYYVVGSRIRDALLIRYKNFNEGISYTMRKNGKPVSVEVHDRLLKALKPYLDFPHEDNDFIFPYLLKNEFDKLNNKEQSKKIQSANRTVNYHLKKIIEQIGIKKNVSTHTARHSFATNYFEETGDLKGISELLNHGDFSTPDRYLRQHGILNKAKKAKLFYDKKEKDEGKP